MSADQPPALMMMPAGAEGELRRVVAGRPVRGRDPSVVKLSREQAQGVMAEVDALRAALAEAEAERDALVPLARLGARALEASREAGEFDSADIQDEAVEVGAVAPVTVTAPCGEYCVCADYGGFPTECYRDTEATTRARALLAPRPKEGR